MLSGVRIAPSGHEGRPLGPGPDPRAPAAARERVAASATAGALPDGTPVIISGSQDGTVRVWRSASGTQVGEPLTYDDGTLFAIAAGTLPDGTPVVISSAAFLQ